MQLYDVNLSLGRPSLAPGRPHTMAKNAISAGEILVLRSVHGDDAVTDIVAIDDTRQKKIESEMEVKKTYATELQYLVKQYSPGAVEKVFGPLGNVQLPAKLQNLAPVELDL